MAVTTKKLFNAVGQAGQSSTTVFASHGIELNNQDDIDVYVTKTTAGIAANNGKRIKHYRQSTASNLDSNHPQVNNTDGLYFPALSISGGTESLENYQLTNNNNDITFNSALPAGAVVFVERRTRDGSGDYTTLAGGSTIRSTEVNRAFDESNFTAQDGRNKALEIEGVLFDGDQPSTNFVTTDHIVAGSIVNADINNNAEIAVSKLANGSARQILQTAANGTDVEFTSNVDIPGTLDVTGNADIDSNLNVDGTLTVASAVDFNNDLDVDGNTNLDNTTIDGYINVTGVATVDNVRIDGNEVRAHSGNLELDSQGGTVTVDDNLTVTGNLIYNGTFNNLSTTETAILDGATVSTAELNILDGVTATTSELNILDGVTATATEINKLDGVTSTTAELNILDGVTATAAEINTLDGITATTAELNLNDGQTATSTEVNILDGATVTTTELNKLDGYTGTAADLNEVVAGKSVVETISGTATDAQIPTAQAVNERVVELVTEVGGFHPIANETSFPSTNPDINDGAGTIVSIKALSSAFTLGSGVTTKVFTNGAGSGVNVTVNGLVASTTYPAGRGMLLETTSTLHTYNYHRLTLDEAGVANAQAVVDDFDERYYGPLGSEPNTRPAGGARVQGDLYFSTADNQMKVWNNAASQWDDVASSASSNIVTLTPAFNGSETEFTCSTVPVDAQSLLLSINGVIQKPNSGTSAPSEGFVKLANGKIKLGSAPLSGATYFAVSLGNTVSVGTPSPNTVGATELKTGEIANTHISSSAAIAGTKISPDFGSQNIVTTGKLGIGTTSLNSVFPLTIQAQYPGIQFLDAQGTDSFGFNADNNAFKIQKGVGGSGPTVLLEMATASSTFSNNLNANAGLDVAGDITVTGTVDGVDVAALSTTKMNKAGDTITGDCTIASGVTNKNIDIDINGTNTLIRFDDDLKATFGDSDDIKIYHDGSNSYFNNTTGFLNIKTTNGGAHYFDADNQYFRTAGGENLVEMIGDGAVKLYHDNEEKLATFDLGVGLPNATGNLGIRWGGANFNYCNIWAEYGSGDLFLAGGLKPKTTNGGFFSSYTGNFSRNAIQINAFGNSGIQFYTSAAQNVTKDDAITVKEHLRILPNGDLRTSSDDVSSNYGLIDGWNDAKGNFIISADHGTTGNASSTDGSAILLKTRGGERARIQHLGGISFNGDTAQANALDDYEEGTYTITALNDGGATLTSNRANYTKIGNMVRISGSFNITATNGQNNNQARFSIPFTSSINGFYVAHGNTVTSTSYTGVALSATIENAGPYMIFNPLVGMSARSWSQLGNNRFDFDVVYRV